MGAALLLAAAPGAEAQAATPSIISEAVSHVTENDATLEAHINTEGLEHGAWYQFQLASDPSEYVSELACVPPLHISLCIGLLLHEGALSIGFVASGSPDQLVTLDLNTGGGLTGVAVRLKPNTTYHYRVIAADAKPSVDVIEWEPPTVFGGDQTFTTPPTPSPPGVSTAGAFATGPTTAIVDGSAEPKGDSTTVHADYSLASEPWCTSHGTEGTPAETAPQSIGAINGVISEIVVKLEGLTPRREYCAELVAHNEFGTAFGGQTRFTTPKKARHKHPHQ